jgi:hypothetical protein
MGMNLNVRMGPVFKVKVYENEKVDSRKTCPNVNCKMHGKELFDSSFCSKCGTSIERVEFKCKVKSDGLENLYDKFENFLFSPMDAGALKIDGQEYNIYIPNYHFSEHEVEVDVDSMFYTTITQERIDKIMSDFMNHKDTKELCNEYKRLIDNKSMVIEFSVFSYHH